MRPRFGTVNAATPTPLRPGSAGPALDRASGKRLCRRWLDVGLDGVLLLGTMGEGHVLSDAVRNAWLELALEEVGDRLTLFVGTADTSRARMMERALRYAKMGAHCVVLCTTPGASPRRCVEDVLAVAEACPAPCAYYEAPFLSGTALVLDEVLEILAHPNIVACKDSSNSAPLAQGLTSEGRRPKGVFLMDGCEYRTPFSAWLGYDGVLHGGGALTGRRVREIWRRAEQRDVAEAMRLEREKALFLAEIYHHFDRPLQPAIGQKFALKCLGVFDHETVALPQTLDEAARARVRAAVEANRSWLA